MPCLRDAVLAVAGRTVRSVTRFGVRPIARRRWKADKASSSRLLCTNPAIIVFHDIISFAEFVEGSLKRVTADSSLKHFEYMSMVAFLT